MTLPIILLLFITGWAISHILLLNTLHKILTMLKIQQKLIAACIMRLHELEEKENANP